MTTSWILFSIFITLLIAVAASAAQAMARLLGWPTRWTWGAGFAAALVLSALAPLRRGVAGGFALPRTLSGSRSIAPYVTTHAVMAGVVGWVEATGTSALRSLLHAIPSSADRYVLLGWLVASLLLGLLFSLVHLRVRRARRAWPRTTLHGTSVRVASDAGPAVFGLVKPEIVVPRWLLERTRAEQQVVLAHEAEHVRAGDHLLLAASGVAVVLLPWNPAVWWMYARLRLAIELDCDARVLGGGVPARSYGNLLIDLAEHSSGLRFGAPALIDGSSHLQTRVMAMKADTYRFARTRASLIALAAVCLLVVACEARLPSAADVNDPDAAGLVRVAAKDSAHVNAALGRVRGDSVRLRSGLNKFTGVLLVDGVRVDPATYPKLDPSEISSVDVYKGPAAMTLYPYPQAVNGVIAIVTKNGAKPPR